MTPTPSHTPVPVNLEDLLAVARGVTDRPHDILGPHLSTDEATTTVRVRRPLATAVTLETPAGTVPFTHEREGVWVAVAPGKVFDYRVTTAYGDAVATADDPYRHLPTVGELDDYLFGEGRHEELWRMLGAHVRTFPSVLGQTAGVAFTVWAPNAHVVRVKGDVNDWDSAGHCMRRVGNNGVWELFIPGAQVGQRYKFEILGAGGVWKDKADPMARATECPPATASVVTASSYEWNDSRWMTQRASHDPHTGPISIYEVHAASWRPGLGYRELAAQLRDYVLDLGYTHVELMPIAEHPFGGSWGYQVTGYYAPTARLGSPDDFRFLVDTLHEAGIGVILDWVPAHFPRDEWALARFDGAALYENPDPMLGEHPDWGTYVFDFGRPQVRNFLVANATYWMEEFHIDGLRVDAVASMLYLDYSRKPGQWRPNRFGGRENLEAIQMLQEVNATAYRRNPGVMMIAEESTPWPGVTARTVDGGLGFGLKWNMGWMNDTLRYLAEAPINRQYHHGEITFSMVYAYSEKYVLPISHDEVVHGKGALPRKFPGDDWQQFATTRALFAYQWTHPGKQLIFMGTDFAQTSEWSESAGLDWWLLQFGPHQGIQRTVRDLNAVYRAHPALWHLDADPSGFAWLEQNDAQGNTLSYLRRDGQGDEVAVVINFSGLPHEGYRVGLPAEGRWLELINTDAAVYGGSGVGNGGAVVAEPVPWNGQPFSAEMRVPPLGALLLGRG